MAEEITEKKRTDTVTMKTAIGRVWPPAMETAIHQKKIPAKATPT
jgi:hypothetical protein